MKHFVIFLIQSQILWQAFATTPSSTKLFNPVSRAGVECPATPCGTNAVCIVKHISINETTSYCTCRRGGYYGDPYKGCTAECDSGAQCGGHKVCSRNECVDACVDFCGENMECKIVNYKPTCTCLPGYHNIPGHSCLPITQTLPNQTPYDPCDPHPCGEYAFCSRRTYKTYECSCIYKNGGKPPNCYPQCTYHADCPSGQECNRSYCVAAQGWPQTTTSSCIMNHCGPFTQKVVVGGRRVCTCLAGHRGIPPNCRPECTDDSECPSQLSCDRLRQECVDPCVGACTDKAICTVDNHSPVCMCTSDAVVPDSDPFKSCYFDPYVPSLNSSSNICENANAECGPNAKCIAEGYFRRCECNPGFDGSPPNCKRECSQNADCAFTKVCINSKCVDPCPGLCGLLGLCSVVEHVPQCSCPVGMSGNPYRECSTVDMPDVCSPTPCGANATCEKTGETSCCKCLPKFYGNPFEGCRPECYDCRDCPAGNTCLRNECIDMNKLAIKN